MYIKIRKQRFDYGIMPTIGLTYNTKHVDFNCDLFGNALITSIKYKF